MLDFFNDIKIISSVSRIINGLTVLKTILTVGIIVFTVFETVTKFFSINKDEELSEI